MTDLQDFTRRLFAAADQLWTNSALRPDDPVRAFTVKHKCKSFFERWHARAPELRLRVFKPRDGDHVSNAQDMTQQFTT